MFVLALILAPAIVALIAAHKIMAGAIAWYVFSNIVDGMPDPPPTAGVAYRWLHKSLNLLAGNGITFLSALFPRFAAIFAKQ